MNFSASEIQEDLEAIKGKLDEGITIDDLLSVVNLPILSEFSQAAGGLLPINLLRVGEDGKVDLLSLTELQQALSQGLGGIKDYLEGEVLGLFETIKGEVKAVTDSAKQVFDELSNLGETIQKDNSLIFDAALSTLNGATGLNLDVQTLANLKNVGTQTINSFAELSPKQIKDLVNPDYFGKVVNTTLDAAINATGAAAVLTGEQSLINDQLDSSGYMSLFQNQEES
jgi:hypothetical protein